MKAFLGFLLTTLLSATIIFGQNLETETSVPIKRGFNFVADSGFEMGQTASSPWTINASTLCNWICDFEAAWNLATFDGNFDLWLGGVCNFPAPEGNVNQVSQFINLPNGEPRIQFHYAAFRSHPADPAGDDEVFVQVNGADVWVLDVSSDTTNNWDGNTGGFDMVTVDLTAFAGLTIILTLGYRTQDLGPGSGNVRIDDVIGSNAVPVHLESFHID